MNYKFYILFLFHTTVFASNDSIFLSKGSGFYESFFLKANSHHGQIVYETDGSEPDNYSKKLNDSLEINETKVIKFGLKINNKIVFKRTCFYLIDFKSSFPVLSISTNPKNLYDNRTGIYVKGPNAWQDSSGYWINANYTKKWEKKVAINYFDSKGNEIINQYSGLRIFGGMTRHRKEKSLRIIARDIYGKKRFNHNFFRYRKNDKYKHLILRNSGGDAYQTRFRDVLTTQISKNLDIDIQEFQPVNLFVNGKFWGVYNLRERIGQHYLNYNFDAKIEESNLLQGLYTEDHGSNKSYKNLRNFISKKQLNNKENMDSINKMMDMKNFIDYNVAQIYFSNKDYMGNIRFWQPNNNGKYRWIMYDTDLGFGAGNRPNYNFLRDRLSNYKTVWHNPPWSTMMLRKLLKNDDVKNQFINQICYSLSTVFKESNINRMIDSIKTLYQPELLRHFKLVRGDSSKWEYQVNKLMTFAKLRPKYLITNTKNQFNLKRTFHLNIRVNTLENGDVFINGNKLNLHELNGLFFNSIPIPLEIIPKPGYKMVVESPNLNDESFLLKKANIYDNKFWSTKQNDTIFNISSDTIHYNIKFKQVDESKWKDNIKINEVGNWLDNKKKLWVELINNTNEKLNFKNWYLMANKKIFNIEINNIEKLFLYEFDEKRSKKIKSLYLFDDEFHLVDKFKWNKSEFKKKMFYEREIPQNHFMTLNKGSGSPNEINPLHKKKIDNWNIFKFIMYLYLLFFLIKFFEGIKKDIIKKLPSRK